MGIFKFRQFEIDDSACGMKICSDSVLLGAWFARVYPMSAEVADVGAGSGVLALICAQYMPHAHICAIEIDSDAAADCNRNIDASKWNSRMRVFNGDFTDWTPPRQLDAIICNPPYFTTGELSADSARAGARHQTTLSYRTLMQQSAKWLSPCGHLGLVSPSDFEDHIIFEAEMAGLKLRRKLNVKTSPSRPATRILWDFSRNDGCCKSETLALREADGRYSEAYRQLTSELYKKL